MSDKEEIIIEEVEEGQEGQENNINNNININEDHNSGRKRKKNLFKPSQIKLTASAMKDLEDTKNLTVNPFENLSPPAGIYEIIKMVVLGLTLLPIRLLLFIILLFFSFICAKIAISGLSKEDLKKPLEENRRKWLKPIKYFSRIILFVFGFYYIPIKGKIVTSAEAPIVTPNHISIFDALFFTAYLTPSYVAKSDVIKIPIIGSIFKSLQPVLVDRNDPNSREHCKMEIQERGESAGEWNQLVLFPEGTTTNGKALISFKYGAFRPGVPVQPVVLKYPFVNLDVSFTAGGLNTFLKALCQFANYCEAEFLEPYVPNENERNNPSLYASNVRKLMAKKLNVIVTEHSFEDVKLNVLAKKRKLAGTGLLEYNKLKKHLGSFSLGDLKWQLQQFSQFDKNNNGFLSYTEFISALNLPDNEAVRETFNLLDADQSGSIDFREFIAGKAAISSTISNQEAIELAFNSFDLNQDGIIDREEAIHVLSVNDLSPNPSMLFDSIDRENEDSITFDEFISFMKKYPEYLSVMNYLKLRSSQNILSLDNDKDEKKTN
eukprot:TRINITY_DN10285_c0_g1_i1.p1 TRINITY_DN10285_c0_g1~~TRINITY_DN10285_c0_g1_i1.p1  ORF type:complete len:548 (-),score=166.43 TRINITY_DN10285_c0_g1_i1:20-1663(-)